MLYIISTPIGNLGDITLRAIDTLKSVDFIICEDTRKSMGMLRHYNVLTADLRGNHADQRGCHSGIRQQARYPESIQIDKNYHIDSCLRRNDKRGENNEVENSSRHRSNNKDLISFYKFSNQKRIDEIIGRIKNGESAALITDAGTPGISDPGQYLIKKALESKINIISIPGPSAIVAALSISGFNTDKFLFLGFLPRKKGRQTVLSKIKDYDFPIVFYESPYRIKKTLLELHSVLGDREVIVARELTKKFETIYRGKISKITDKIKEKGEFTVVINKS